MAKCALVPARNQRDLPIHLRSSSNEKHPSDAMPIAALTVEIAIEHAQSLKDRRQVVRSLKDRLRHGFNISVAELDDALLWNRATLGIAAISHSRDYLQGQMREVERALNRLSVGLGATVVDISTEILDEL